MNSKQEIQDSTEDANDLTAQTISDVGIYFSSAIKISDPNNGEILLHMRGDE